MSYDAAQRRYDFLLPEDFDKDENDDELSEYELYLIDVEREKPRRGCNG